MAFPPAPWQLRGQSWFSVFLVKRAVDAAHPAGVYAVALVDYRPGSPLTYHELLVARTVGKGRRRRVCITDIWVDSPDSRDGGRALWAIPKELAAFTHRERHWGPVARADWSVRTTGQPVARARFLDASRLAPRLPFRGGTWQPPVDEHTDPVTADLRGSSKALPCWASWEFAADGPLGWLGDHRPLLSARMADVAMTFG